MADVATAQLNNLTLGSKTPTLLAKRPPGKAGRPIEVNTNLTPITLKEDVSYFRYDIRMYAVFTKKDGSEVVKEFSKQTKDDFIEQERKYACSEIFLALTNSVTTFKGDLIYDRAAILFSTEKLAEIGQTDVKFNLAADCQTICEDATRVEVTIKQALTSFHVTSNDLASAVNADFKNQPKGFLDVLHLATSQIPFFRPADFITYGNGNIYLQDASKFGFHESEAPPIGTDKFIRIGLSKGVKILEGFNPPAAKDYIPALVLDVKKTAFHLEHHTLTDKLRAMYPKGLPKHTTLVSEFKDLRCYATHRKASIVIGGFTVGGVEKATFNDAKSGKRLGILEYYNRMYPNARITHPDLPGVIDKHTGNIYPTDLLKVAPLQRVKGTQATKETVETLIKVSAIKPDIRLQQTQRVSKLLELDSEKAAKLGVSVPANQATLVVPGRQLEPIKLLGGQGGMAGPSWRGSNKFVVGAKVDKWAAFLFYNGTGKPRYSPQDVFSGFVKKVMEAGNRKGMRIPDPALVDQFDGRATVESQVSVAMKKASEAGCSFVLVVSDEKLKTHDQLKYEELLYKLTTQEVTLAKAGQVVFENKSQTMDNIIMKTNAKLRGMNHVAANSNGLHNASDILIMGLFIQQPRGMSAKEIEEGGQPSMPVVIGLSANNGKMQDADPQQREMSAQQYFTSSWKYANPKEWKTGETQSETLKKMIVSAFELFWANRGIVPSKVVVYRGGVSEGQLSYVAGEERDVFHAAFTQLMPNYNPAFVIIACSKEHNDRFYHKVFPRAPPGGKVDTNLPPGTIVDSVVVNPEMNEFYLQSHKALQGTAKATKYTLLHDSTGRLGNDNIQHMTHALCHLHEVVNSTTAVPTPLYVAEESAKRAVNIYHHIRGANDRYDIDDVNGMFSYQSQGARINA